MRGRLLVTGMLAVGLLAGCTGDAERATPAADRPVAESITDAAALRPSGVLLAAVLLATGDVGAAVAEGIVSPEEVDAAVAAVAAGDLDRWRVAASSGSR
jgi:hypothetical protein